MKDFKEIAFDLVAAGIAGIVGEGVGKLLRYVDAKHNGGIEDDFEKEDPSDNEDTSE